MLTDADFVYDLCLLTNNYKVMQTNLVIFRARGREDGVENKPSGKNYKC